jgi:tRNA dimethylallyltransferase
MSSKKIIAILGPTASGKSALAVKIAKKFGGEVISVDSRQVYKGMNIGTGKVKRDNSKLKSQKSKLYLHQGIVHYLLDVASPKRKFTVAQFQKLAKKAIEKIFKKGKIPILCGGTGFYLWVLTQQVAIPKVKPDWKLRKKLEKKSAKELFEILKKLDPERAKTIEKDNKRRLIRAIEIAKKLGKVPPLKTEPLPYPILFLGIKKSKGELKKLIKRRLLKRLKEGMIEEVKKLRKSGISWKRLEEFGLEYEWIAKYLQGKIGYKEMVESLQKDIENFAKKQMTYFKKYFPQTIWIRNYKEAERVVNLFLKQKVG